MPQSAVIIAMCSNYFKVANLKQSKIRIVHLLSSTSLALLLCNVISVAFETATSGKGILCRWHFCASFERNCDITPCAFRSWGQSVLAVGHYFVGACARMTHQLQVHGWHHITKKSRNKKRNLPNV